MGVLIKGEHSGMDIEIVETLAYKASDGSLFLNLDECEDYELSLRQIHFFNIECKPVMDKHLGLLVYDESFLLKVEGYKQQQAELRVIDWLVRNLGLEVAILEGRDKYVRMYKYEYINQYNGSDLFLANHITKEIIEIKKEEKKHAQTTSV